MTRAAGLCVAPSGAQRILVLSDRFPVKVHAAACRNKYEGTRPLDRLREAGPPSQTYRYIALVMADVMGALAVV